MTESWQWQPTSRAADDVGDGRAVPRSSSSPASSLDSTASSARDDSARVDAPRAEGAPPGPPAARDETTPLVPLGDDLPRGPTAASRTSFRWEERFAGARNALERLLGTGPSGGSRFAREEGDKSEASTQKALPSTVSPKILRAILACVLIFAVLLFKSGRSKALESENKVLKSENGDMLEMFHQEDEELNRVRSENVALQEKLAGLAELMKEKIRLEDKVAALNKRLEESERQRSQLVDEKSGLANTVARLEEDKGQLRERVEQIDDQLAKVMSEKATLAEMLADLKREHDALEERAAAVQEDVAALATAKGACEDKLARWEEEAGRREADAASCKGASWIGRIVCRGQ